MRRSPAVSVCCGAHICTRLSVCRSELQGETKILKLKNLRPKDYANYSCIASVRNVCDIADRRVVFRLTNKTGLLFSHTLLTFIYSLFIYFSFSLSHFSNFFSFPLLLFFIIILFYFILFYFILFYFILFYFILFYTDIFFRFLLINPQFLPIPMTFPWWKVLKNCIQNCTKKNCCVF